MPTIPKSLQLNRLAGLPAEVKVEKLVSHPHSMEFYISFPPPAERFCPKCHSSNCVIKDNGRVRTLRHIPRGSTATLLTFRQRRYRCKECGSTHYEQIYWMHPSISITSDLFMNIREGLNSPISIRRIAQNNVVSENICIW